MKLPLASRNAFFFLLLYIFCVIYLCHAKQASQYLRRVARVSWPESLIKDWVRYRIKKSVNGGWVYSGWFVSDGRELSLTIFMDLWKGGGGIEMRKLCETNWLPFMSIVETMRVENWKKIRIARWLSTRRTKKKKFGSLKKLSSSPPKKPMIERKSSARIDFR